MVSEDRIYFVERWQSIQCCEVITCINVRYFARFMIRIFDVTLRVLSILLLWIIVGGLYALIYVGFELSMLLLMAICTKKYVNLH